MKIAILIGVGIVALIVVLNIADASYTKRALAEGARKAEEIERETQERAKRDPAYAKHLAEMRAKLKASGELFKADPEQMARRRAARAAVTELRDKCLAVRERRVADLTVRDLDLLRSCRSLGVYE